jgi:hypothetical protein
MEKWKRDWFKEINTRVRARSSYPTEGVSNDDVFAQGFLIVRRHAHAAPNQNDGSNENDRNFRPAWNQPCIEFLDALEEKKKVLEAKKTADPRMWAEGLLPRRSTRAWQGAHFQRADDRMVLKRAKLNALLAQIYYRRGMIEEPGCWQRVRVTWQ